jgi:hypothetical protein
MAMHHTGGRYIARTSDQDGPSMVASTTGASWPGHVPLSAAFTAAAVAMTTRRRVSLTPASMVLVVPLWLTTGVVRTGTLADAKEPLPRTCVKPGSDVRKQPDSSYSEPRTL